MSAVGLRGNADLRAYGEALTRHRPVVTGIAMLAAVAAFAVAGFGGTGRDGPLDWAGPTEVFAHPTLPGDRVLTGMLRNDGVHAIRVDIGDVRLIAADGSTVESAPVFLEAPGRSLWAAGRGPVQVPDSELRRTGRIALLSPGEHVPLTVAWHAKAGTPMRVEYGEGSLTVPG